ncbi:MAG: glycosyl transferase family 2, partial [Gemmatimonadales bacterium]
YGDQGLLVRRSLYDAVGGYPNTRIMEDVVLIRRIVRRARLERLPAPILADARRWRREGQVRGTLRNVALLTPFLAGIAPDRLARWYLPEPGEQ